jgi:poly(beta-D-mannuronate) lyase
MGISSIGTIGGTVRSLPRVDWKVATLVSLLAALGGCDNNGSKKELGQNVEGTALISGTAIVGGTLTAEVSDGNGIASDITYQWIADGTDIAGETSSTYTALDSDIGSILTVTVSYTDKRDTAETVTSTPSDPIVTNAINSDGTVAITGSARVNEMLTAVVTDDNGTTGSTIAYQWQVDSVDIAGATAMTYTVTVAELGAMITADASYTDDDGFVEANTSPAIGPVVASGVNTPGSLSQSGMTIVGETLTATITDADGTGVVNYQWQADGVDIASAIDMTYVLTAAERNKVISVNAEYTDNGGNAEGPLTATATDVVYTAIVDGEAALVAAVAAAVDGDVIGLGSADSDDYLDMAELELATDNVTLRLVTGSTAVITGSTCIVYGSSSTGITIDGLVFDDLSNPNTSNCGEGEGSIRLQGSNNTFRNNQILGQIDLRPGHIGTDDELHYMTVGGTDNVVERNLFEGLPTSEGKEGAAISMFVSRTADSDPVNQSNGSNERNIIQYNLFRNFLPDVTENGGTEWDTDSNGFGIQIGRSSGRDGAGLGAHVVQYNRFDTVLTDRRIILVQGGGNTIHGNTIVNSWGNIALEHGYGNTVSSNIVVSNGTGYTADFGGMSVSDNLDGGISFAPLGHTITNNYVANIASNSADRAALLIDSETLEDSDSSSMVIRDSGLDLTTVVAGNTIINSQNAIQFEHNAEEGGIENCLYFDYLLDFDDNLIANQSGTVGESRTAILLDEYTTPHGCRLNDASEFTNTHIYSQTIADDDILFRAGGMALVTGINGNIAADSSEDGATLTAADANGLVEGTGADAGIGADIDALNFITEDMVGPGSTWMAP